MKIIEQQIHSFEETPTDFDGCLKLIERAGRCCYGSKPSEYIERTRRFVEGLIKRGHLSVLRHSNLVIWDEGEAARVSKYINSYQCKSGGNWQAWLESKFRHCEGESLPMWLDWLESRDCDPAPPELKRYTCHLTTSLRNSHQLVRHTTLSVSQKSTRYIDHSNLEVIKPWWYDDSDSGIEWHDSMISAETNYQILLAEGLSKEDAADVLPKATATEMWVTADRDAWLNVKAQRLGNSTGKASRQIQDLMSLIPWEVIE